MSAPVETSGCHEVATPTEYEIGEDLHDDCCAIAPQEPVPVGVESVLSWGLPAPTPLGLTLESLQTKPPPAPLVTAACVVSTQQHELGRFTLLSSFLL